MKTREKPQERTHASAIARSEGGIREVFGGLNKACDYGFNALLGFDSNMVQDELYQMLLLLFADPLIRHPFVWPLLWFALSPVDHSVVGQSIRAERTRRSRPLSFGTPGFVVRGGEAFNLSRDFLEPSALHHVLRLTVCILHVAIHALNPSLSKVSKL